MADEAKNLLGDIVCAVVKVSLDRYSDHCPHPSVARKRMRDAAEKAVRKIDRFRPSKFVTPIQMEIDYVNTVYALRASYIPIVERIVPRIVRWSPSELDRRV